MSVGDAVEIRADGRRGTVTAVIPSPDCRCKTVFVRLARGEWAGKATELRRLRG